MPNADTPRGLIPRRHQSGAPYNGAVNIYFMPASDATAAYRGGLVKMAGSADANGVATVTANVATGDVVLGVIMGFSLDNREHTTLVGYRAASTARYVHVCDDPDIMFEIQEDSVGGALAAGDVGEVADLATITSGSTTTGWSSMELDSSTATATNDGTFDVKIMRLSPEVNNEIGDNAKWLVRLLNHEFQNNDPAGV